MSNLIHTVGVIRFSNKTTGGKTGCIDVCVDENGNVHLHVNAIHGDAVVKLTKAHAMTLANLLSDAVGAPL